METFAQSLQKGIVHSTHIKKLLNMLQRIKELLKHWGQKRDHRKTERKSSEWQGGRCRYQDTYFT